MQHAVSALEVVAASIVDQYAPHHLGRNCEEVSAILPLHALIVHQAHVSLIDEGGRLKGMARALAFHVAVRKAAKFVINDGREPLERALISRAPGAEERAYLKSIELAWHSAVPAIR